MLAFFQRLLLRYRKVRYTEHARAAMARAQEIAAALSAPAVGPEHLLAAVVLEGRGGGVSLLRSLDLSLGHLKGADHVQLARSEGGQRLPLQPATGRVLDGAFDAAQRLGDNQVDTEHLIVALAEEEPLRSELDRAGVRGIAMSIQLQALRILSRGEVARLAERWAEAVAAYREVLALKPGDRPTTNNLAWILATCPDRTVRDGKEARALMAWARDEVGTPRWYYTGTLAAACAEAGRFDEAVVYGMRAQEMAQGADGGRWAVWLAGFAQEQPIRDPGPCASAG